MTRPLGVALRPLGLGDFCTGVPALRALRRAFPEHTLLLGCAETLHDIAVWSGAVDGVLPAVALQPLPVAHAPDVAVDLHGRGPASQRILLRTRPRHLLAFANDEVAETAGMPRWNEDEHEAVRWCRMLGEQGISADPSDLLLEVPGTDAGARSAGCVVVHPGAAYASRRWPLQRFASVAQHIARNGVPVVVSGDESERALCAELVSLVPGARSVAGTTSLMELLSIVGGARLVVSGDTGVAHLATATRTPSVVLFGPTPPAEWGPLRDPHLHRVLWTGGRGDPHGISVDAGLMRIQLEDVITAVDELMQLAVHA